ncbi:MAG: TRAP transporter substrate-binding protein [Defluviicoccus sp.]|nr:TRAP transporter substrate-binding protein [Defluviicoccus sp.]
MVMVTTWPRDFPGLGTGAQRLAKRINDATDGRIHVQYFAAGERVGAFDSFDEVASGNAQAYHAADYYWKGKHPGWAYYSSVPFGLTYTEVNAWIRFGGGQELWDELAGKFGLKCLAAGNTGVQMGGWFNKEINSSDDLKGLKMRIPGLGGDVMAKLGASPVSLPGAQIYENLVSGAIDATEWVGPWNDSFLKFYEAAKYYYYPGMHEPGTMLSFGMNASWWGKLSKSDQTIIESLAAAENDIMMAEYNAKNGAALTRLLTDHGVKLRRFNDDVYDSFGEGSAEVFETVRAHSDLANRIHESFLKTRKDVGGWAKIADQAYLAQRNRVLGV